MENEFINKVNVFVWNKSRPTYINICDIRCDTAKGKDLFERIGASYFCFLSCHLQYTLHSTAHSNKTFQKKIIPVGYTPGEKKHVNVCMRFMKSLLGKST